MAWGFGANLALSGAMYAGIGALTYDETQTDPLNQTLKIGGAFAIDQAVDIGIMGIGGAISRGYSLAADSYGERFGVADELIKTKMGGHVPDHVSVTKRRYDPSNIIGNKGSQIKRMGDKLTMFGAKTTAVGAGITIGGGGLTAAAPIAGGAVEHFTGKGIDKLSPFKGKGATRGIARFLGGATTTLGGMAAGVATGVAGTAVGAAGVGMAGVGATMSAVGRMNKPLDWAMRRAGGVGLAAHMALGFMGMDPASIFMNTWEEAESNYRNNIRRKPMQLTQASSRYIQDQLHSMRGAGNEAEFMHN